MTVVSLVYDPVRLNRCAPCVGRITHPYALFIDSPSQAELHHYNDVPGVGHACAPHCDAAQAPRRAAR